MLSDEITAKELRRVFECLVVHCLNKLVEQGFVTADQINQSGWYVQLEDNSRLVSERFLAAASLDKNLRPFIAFDTQTPLTAQVWSIPHEVVHLAQLCKSDWIPCWGYSLWKGERFEKLPAEHPRYFDDQPWEAEAKSLEDLIRTDLYQAYPEFKVL